MPVLLTAAETPLGQQTAHWLSRDGAQVRAYCRPGGDAGHLRSLGAFVSVGDLDDEGRLEAAMTGVHTVVHLAGGLLSRSADHIVRGTDTVVTAAVNAGVQRLIMLSLPGAGHDAGDPLRRAKGESERLVRKARLPSVVLRTSLVDSPRLRDALASARLPRHVLDRLVAPVGMDGLVALLVALDAVRSTAHEGHVVFAVDGPVRMTLEEALQRLGLAAPLRSGALIGHEWLPADRVPLLAPALDGPWTAVPELPDAWAFTGVTPVAGVFGAA